MDDPMRDLPPAIQEAVERVMQEFVTYIVETANQALAEADLDATIVPVPTARGFELLVRSHLPPDQHSLAEDIADAVLQRTFMQDEPLH